MAQEFKVIASADVAALEKGMSDARKSLASTAVAAQKLDSSLGSMAKGSTQATSAMTNFGRIIQDAPFGIIGITNNINPLLESFQRLKAETGSTGAAMKALAGSLLGAGGLGFAVSIVSSLLTIFALNNRSSSKETKEHKEKVDEAKKAADEYASAISAASSAVISHQGEMTELNRVLKDTSNNFNVLSKSIVNSALAEYLATQKEGLIKNILDAKIKEILAAQSAFSKIREFTTKDLFSKDPLKKQIAESSADLVNLNNLVRSLGLEDLFAGIFKLDPAKKVKDIRTIQDVLDDLSNQLKFIKEKNELINSEKAKANISAIESALDELLKKFNLGTKNKIVIDLAFRINKANYDILSSEFLAREIERLKTGDPKRTLTFEPKIVIKPRLVFESANFTEEMRIQLQKAIDITASSMLSITSSAITSVLEGIANIANGKGGIGDIFNGLARALGSGVKQFGKQILELALLAKLAKLAIKNPITGIAAGIALIALGAAIEAATSKNAFATGVSNFGGGLALVGERGPELVSLPKGSNVHTNGQLNAMGNRELIVSGTLKASGTELVAVIEKATAYNSRNGF